MRCAGTPISLASRYAEFAGGHGFEFAHRRSPSMIIHDLDVFSAGIGPTEAYAKLIIDPDAMLSDSIISEGFQTIARWHPHIVPSSRDFQFAECCRRFNDRNITGFAVAELQADEIRTINE
jgi:hypothetical protein